MRVNCAFKKASDGLSGGGGGGLCHPAFCFLALPDPVVAILLLGGGGDCRGLWSCSWVGATEGGHYRGSFALAFLAAIQLEAIYAVDGLGPVWVMYISTLLRVIPLTAFFALLLLIGRIRTWNLRQKLHHQYQSDEFYAGRMGFACAVATGVAIMSIPAIMASVAWLGASVTQVASLAVALQIGGLFVMAWVSDVTRRFALRRRWETLGYATRIKGCQSYPEYVVRVVKQYEEGIEIARNRREILSFGVFGAVSLLAGWAFGQSAIVFILVALGLILAGDIWVSWRDRTKRKEAWYTWVATRGDDGEMFREVSRRTTLGWPDGER